MNVERLNLALTFAETFNVPLEELREETNGSCIDFAGDLIEHLGKGRLAYFETPNNHFWKYHAAVEIDGVIHDLWKNEPMDIKEFMDSIGATEVCYPAEESA